MEEQEIYHSEIVWSTIVLYLVIFAMAYVVFAQATKTCFVGEFQICTSGLAKAHTLAACIAPPLALGYVRAVAYIFWDYAY